MKVHELLTDESKWIKGEVANTESGSVCGSTSKDAVCWCLAGAINKCYGHSYGAIIVIKNRINIHLGGNLIMWNDVPERTFEDIKNLVTELDI